MSAPLRRFGRGESGQIVVLVAILFLALVFAVALTVNSGELFIARRAAQTAADAGALAGAVSLRFDSSVTPGQTNAMAAAKKATSLNGYTDLAGGVTVAVSFPSPGPNGSTNAVQVVITSSIGATLTPQWGNTTVKATGVAGGGSPASQAIFALGTGNLFPALNVQQGTLIMYSPTATGGTGPNGACAAADVNTLPCMNEGGTAQVNSCASTCSQVTCSSQSNQQAAQVNTGGSVGPTGSLGATLDVTGCAIGSWPNAVQGSPVLLDPYAGAITPPPPTGSCSSASSPTQIPCSTQTACQSNSNCTMQPGIYASAESWNTRATYSLCPGTYIFTGSSISTSGNNGLLQTVDSNFGNGATACPRTTPLTPQGVLLFFTYDSYPNAIGSSGCGSLSLGGNGTSNLAPQTKGTYAGLLLYGDPACSGSKTNTGLTVGGNGAYTTTGLTYFPTAPVQMNGKQSQAVSGIIAWTINVQNGTVVANVSTAAASVATATRLVQ